MQQTTTDKDRFLSIDEAATRLGISAIDLRQGIARGIIPVRRDNEGTIRVHCDEVPNNLASIKHKHPIDPELLATVYESELHALNNKIDQGDALNTQVEQLLSRQSAAIKRATNELDSRDNRILNLETQLQDLQSQLNKSEGETKHLTDLLDRSFTAIARHEEITQDETAQLTNTTEKAMNLLQRALDGSENNNRSRTTVNPESNALFEGAAVERLEREISQRDKIIDNQNKLMERMVALSEKTVSQSNKKPRKRSFWQRLWGGGKGI